MRPKSGIFFWGILAALLTVFSPQGSAAPFSRSELLNETPPEGEVWLGEPDAPILVVEYASLTCVHCANYHMSVFPTIKRDYIDTKKIRYVYRHYPLDNLAFAAAMLVAAAPQERRFPLIETLMESQKVWMRNDSKGPALLKIARQAGFSRKQFEASLKNQETYAAIQKTRKRAQETFGVDSTPTLILNGETLRGPTLKKFRAALDAALEKNAPAAP